MNKKKNIIILSLFLLLSCKGNLPILPILPVSARFNNSPYNYIFEDFPNEDNTSSGELYYEQFAGGGIRIGRITNNFKEGRWLSGDAGFDDKGNTYIKTGIWREEYFKHGLRDSVFRHFDQNNKIKYETNFKMGTGLWKEFHSNGTIYFEIQTKDGYFTDTLKLYNDKGRLIEKRFYLKDSLVYAKDLIIDENSTDNKN